MNNEKITWSNLSGWIKTILIVSFISNSIVVLSYIMGFIEGYLGLA